MRAQDGNGRAVVVGSGPNGLSAAVALAGAGMRVTVLEAADRIGGGTRTEELTLPGFLHDVCSSVHPMGAGSPWFRSLPLGDHGLEWIHPPIPLAHPFDDGSAALLLRSVDETAAGLAPDDASYRRFMGPFVARWDALLAEALAPPLSIPRRPVLKLRLGWFGLPPAARIGARIFSGERGRALFAGIAAHAILPLENPVSAAFGVMLAAAGHGAGWPFAHGGSSAIANALAGLLGELGGDIRTGSPVRSLEDLPAAESVLLDLGPRQVARVAGPALPRGYRRWLERFRYGPGVFKVDWALSEPIPWTNGDCRAAGTVHVGGTAGEVARALREAWEGRTPERPFVLVAQPSLFDPSRAPEGRHTAWAYCHVPHGSRADMTAAIEAQVERFAPGFGDTVLARSTRDTHELEAYNANLIGGDITGGVQDLRQFLFRPVPRLDPHATPVPGLYICSASTPPGGGVHGMCGYHAARSALRRR